MTTTGQPVDLSVVLPAYNEEAVIGELVRRATNSLDAKGLRYEIQVVDDGSRDGTGEVLTSLRETSPALRVVTHESNRGYGAALRSGIEAARGEHILLADGDGQFRIEDFEALWSRREQADVVLGYRKPRHDPWVRKFAGWMYGRVLVRLALGGRFRDVNCGFKLVPRRIVDGMELHSTGALISAELLTRARLAGATFVEIGVDHFPRRRGAATGLLPRVVLQMVRELVTLRHKILSAGRASRRSGLRPDCDAVESASA